MNNRSTKKESRCSCVEEKKQSEGNTVQEENVHLAASHSHLSLCKPITLFPLLFIKEI